MHCSSFAMRYYEEEDPKLPQPTRGGTKDLNAWEADEANEAHEVGPARKDHERDHHRHVRL